MQDHEVDLAAAAVRLGITPEAVRKRIHRHQLTGIKRGGKWYVVLPADQNGAGPHPDSEQDHAALVEQLRSENAYLRRQLESTLADLTEEARRRDHIIAGLLQRVAELPAPPGQDTAGPEQDTRQDRPSPGQASAPAPAAQVRRPWWAFWRPASAG